MVEKVSTLFQPFYPSAYSACRYVRFTAYDEDADDDDDDWEF
jgi:hypothetical protein